MAVVAPAAEEGRPVLSVENVDVRFGGIQALKGVSLNVRMGEICGLIGPNGAGKTTLFNCVTRLSPCHRRDDPATWTGDRNPASPSNHPHGNCPDIPEPRHLCRHDRARECHARCPSPQWRALCRRFDAARAFAPTGAGDRASLQGYPCGSQPGGRCRRCGRVFALCDAKAHGDRPGLGVAARCSCSSTSPQAVSRMGR